MSTKIVAARLATSAGVTTVITRSSRPGNIVRIVQYSRSIKTSIQEDGTSDTSVDMPLHTRFLPDPHPIRDRYFWLLHGLAPHGTVYIDQGAYAALANKAGLLPAGIVHVEGNFSQQEAVRLLVVQRGKSTFHSSASATTRLPSLPAGFAAGGDHPTIDDANGDGTVPDDSNTIRDGNSTATGHVTTTIAIPPPPPSSSSNDDKNPSKHDPPPHSSETVKGDDMVDERGSKDGKEDIEKAAAAAAAEGEEVGRALVNYSATEITRIKGLKSTEIEKVLGYADSEYVALRENISFFHRDRKGVENRRSRFE